MKIKAHKIRIQRMKSFLGESMEHRFVWLHEERALDNIFTEKALAQCQMGRSILKEYATVLEQDRKLETI